MDGVVAGSVVGGLAVGAGVHLLFRFVVKPHDQRLIACRHQVGPSSLQRWTRPWPEALGDALYLDVGEHPSPVGTSSRMRMVLSGAAAAAQLAEGLG